MVNVKDDSKGDYLQKLYVTWIEDVGFENKYGGVRFNSKESTVE